MLICLNKSLIFERILREFSLRKKIHSLFERKFKIILPIGFEGLQYWSSKMASPFSWIAFEIPKWESGESNEA